MAKIYDQLNIETCGEGECQEEGVSAGLWSP